MLQFENLLFPPAPQRIISVYWLPNEWLKSQIPQQPSSTHHGPCFLSAERSQGSFTQGQISGAQVLFHRQRGEVWEDICRFLWDHNLQAIKKLCWPPAPWFAALLLTLFASKLAWEEKGGSLFCYQKWSIYLHIFNVIYLIFRYI